MTELQHVNFRKVDGMQQQLMKVGSP